MKPTTDTETCADACIADTCIELEQTFRVIVFTIYSLIYESIIWGLFGWAVFVQGHSGWWFLAAGFMSGSQLKPSAFGIK